MGSLSQLINAIAALAWPALALIFLFRFELEIRNILKRLSHIKKGKVFGQEIELDTELIQLRESADKTQNEAIVAIPPASDIHEQAAVANSERRILEEAGKSPTAALLLVSSEIGRRLRQLLAGTGWQKNISPTSPLSAIEKLVAQGTLPNHASSSFKLFQDVRTKLVHGGEATDKDIFRAIDSGLTLLRAIEAVPTEKNTVHKVGVDLFTDPQCSSLITDAKGIILETTSPGGVEKSFRIFPTTRSHFRKGERVAWEWSFGKTWGPAWYRDPGNDEVKQAWVSAAEFIGRHLEDL